MKYVWNVRFWFLTFLPLSFAQTTKRNRWKKRQCPLAVSCFFFCLFIVFLIMTTTRYLSFSSFFPLYFLLFFSFKHHQFLFSNYMLLSLHSFVSYIWHTNYTSHIINPSNNSILIINKRHIKFVLPPTAPLRYKTAAFSINTKVIDVLNKLTDLCHFVNFAESGYGIYYYYYSFYDFFFLLHFTKTSGIGFYW